LIKKLKNEDEINKKISKILNSNFQLVTVLDKIISIDNNKNSK
jgi:hypothetical protein